ncbi:aminotransferase class V-fold PLP-dependent enzyme [Salmonella enterica]|nr:aminotransferase class V-fold PLP-dependent enzyme [Salmonella enterica]EDS4734250.1 aminotransferase class V-fold PLP-dependent enzyme [Salmonella enterica subsp. enterica serovar Oranienburg]EGX8050473.1 aminotransferase class V-fold PLP-dependent enzyme [Salmonella enterica subsp. enterica serovar Inganda]EEH2567617.1 aminotransferase class V-fold PLP-dependent enzyme [Salmonella enterica]EGX8054896.1 aminotransferase class V-fold PLP-dependent enzyme [Salmonella enterica subsp. enterica 
MKNYTMFSDKELKEIREKFYYVDEDITGTKRIYFDNAGGAFRLKSAEEAFHRIDRIPDCSERQHKMALFLQDIEEQGRRDASIIFNSQSGAIYPGYTASQIMFDIIRVISENAPGSNMVTSILEHPSAFDSISNYALRHDCELRVATSNPLTGGVDAEEVIKLVDRDTAILSVMGASNVSGYIYDINKIVTMAREINPDIYIIIDAVQHAPHGVLDVAALPIDAMTIAPYKFYGVRGFGLAWLSDRVAKLAHHKLNGKKESDWELGSPAPAHYAALTEIVNYVCGLGNAVADKPLDRRSAFVAGMHRIENQERGLLNILLNGSETTKGLRGMQGVHVCVDNPNLDERDLIIGIAFDNLSCEQAVREFEKHNIIVYERTSSSLYSRRMVQSFNIDGMIRVSPLHCNSRAEIEEFLRVTNELTHL